MNKEAYMKKSFLFTYIIVSIIFLVLSIYFKNTTLIFSSGLITVFSLWMTYTYSKKPALTFYDDYYTFQTVFNTTTEFHYKNINNLSINEKQTKITFFYEENKYPTTIQNSYTIHTKEIYQMINQKVGETK